MNPYGSTSKLVRTQVRRAIQLLRIAERTPDLAICYDALGLALDVAGQADEMLCTLPDRVLGIPAAGGRKPRATFEQIVFPRTKAVAV